MKEPSARPWIVLQTTHDVEAWMDNLNRELQQFEKRANANGYGICFSLAQGGDIFVHTTSEGDVLLDVTEEAEWVAPVITAVTGVEAPRARIWALPADTLTQLVFGLNSLIASTRIVLDHSFKTKKY